MKPSRTYSDLLSCIYDEAGPVGRIGRGTHYSVFRTACFIDLIGERQDKAGIHDFAVIWDEDHDERIIPRIERLYMAGLLTPVLAIGERKGGLSVLVQPDFEQAGCKSLRGYSQEVARIIAGGSGDDGDEWDVRVGQFDDYGKSSRIFDHSIIHADNRRVHTYLSHIESMWRLGVKPYVPGQPPFGWVDPAPAAD